MKNIQIEHLLVFFLGTFILGFCIQHLTALKYIGLYGSIILYLFYLLKEKKLALYNYKFLCKDPLIRVLQIFILFLFFNILIGYGNKFIAIKEFRSEFLNIGIVFIIALSLPKKLLQKIIYFIIAAYFYEIFYYMVHYYQKNPNLNFSIRLDRNFANYLEILFPFALGYIFITKNTIIKILLILTIPLALFEAFLTGARGVWLSISFEILFFVIIYLGFYKKNIKKAFLFIFFLFLTITLFAIYLYQNSSLIKTKINQGIDPNGRETIVKTRLPIFLKHSNILIGIGGIHTYQYNVFLNKYNAPKIFGKQTPNGFHYHADEPFILHLIYTNGILGTILFFIISFLIIKAGFKHFNIFILSILTSFLGYYYVRGIAELRSLKYLLFYILLIIIFKEENHNETSDNIS